MVLEMLCNDVMTDGVNVTVDSGASLKQLHLTPCPYAFNRPWRSSSWLQVEQKNLQVC